MEDPVQPVQQTPESPEAVSAPEQSDERAVSELETTAESPAIEAEEEVEPSEAKEILEDSETEVPQEKEIVSEDEEANETAFLEEEKEGELEEEPEATHELANSDFENEQFEGKEIYPEMFASAADTNYQEFDDFFSPSYEEMAESLKNPIEQQTISNQQAEELPARQEEAMPTFDTLEASNRAADWISQTREDEEPSIQIDPSLLTF